MLFQIDRDNICTHVRDCFSTWCQESPDYFFVAKSVHFFQATADCVQAQLSPSKAESKEAWLFSLDMHYNYGA